MPDHDGGAQHGDRDPAVGQEMLDLPPRSQVRRQVPVVDAQAAQVDDALETGVGGGVPERAGRIGVAVLEVGGLQRVHEVVGRVTPSSAVARLSASPTSP